jgi:hypothetical protein
VKEFQIEPQTLQTGSVWDLVLSEDSAQRYVFIADGANMQVLTIDRWKHHQRIIELRYYGLVRMQCVPNHHNLENPPTSATV